MSNLSGLTVDQLKQICLDRGYRGYSRLKKAELIELLSDDTADINTITDDVAKNVLNQYIDYKNDSTVLEQMFGNRFKFDQKTHLTYKYVYRDSNNDKEIESSVLLSNPDLILDKKETFLDTNLILTEYFQENGKLSQVLKFENNTTESFRYDINGKLSLKTQYTDNILNGAQINYYSDGTIKSKTKYNMGTKIESHTYFPNGKVNSFIAYSFGNLSTVEIMNELDETIITEIYNADGIIKKRTTLLGKIPDVDVKNYTVDEAILYKIESFDTDNGLFGIRQSTSTMLGNIMHGIQSDYYSNGIPRIISNRKYGYLDGLYIRYDSSGNPIEKSEYLDGNKISEVLYHSNGTKKSIKNFDSKGKQIGLYQEYDSNGKLITNKKISSWF